MVIVMAILIIDGNREDHGKTNSDNYNDYVW